MSGESLVNEVSLTLAGNRPVIPRKRINDQIVGFPYSDTTSHDGQNESSVTKDLLKLKSNLADFYVIGLWGYCEGKSGTLSREITRCTKPDIGFWFNFTDVFGLQGPWADRLHPPEVERAEHVYRIASKGMKSAYIIAFISSSVMSSVGIIFGLTVQSSTGGGLVINIIAGVSHNPPAASHAGLTFIQIAAVASMAASGLATGVYVSLAEALNIISTASGFQFTIGRQMVIITWLAALFCLASSVFCLINGNGRK